MASRLSLARMGAAVLGASAALMISVLPANAASPNGVTGTVNTHGGVPGANVVMDYNGGAHQVPTELISLKLSDGSPVLTYCVELTVDLDPSVGMTEVGWDKYPDPNSPFTKNGTYINWVLHNSFPSLSDLGALGKSAGTTTPLTVKEAIAGTQAAIWHYSDNATLDPNQNSDQNITALYAYLTGSGNTGIGQPANPPASPSVTISPDKASGTAPGLVGPYTVSSNLGVPLQADTKALPAGVKLTDAQGKAIDLSNVGDGTKFYFDVPSGTQGSSASVTLNGDLQIGRLFIGDGENQQEASTSASVGGLSTSGNAHTHCAKPTQSLIVAQSTPASATAAASWTLTTTTTTPPTTGTTAPTTTAPGGVVPTTTTPPQVKNTSSSLPFTGVNIIAPVVLGVVLIGAGGAFLILQRRRKRV